MLADNKLNEWAGWNRETLVVELGELANLLPELALDLSITGFEPAEIDILFADKTSQHEPMDSLPEVDRVAVTQPGDVWQLDQHRLMCASALNPQSFTVLMADKKARMVFADPPYNVRIADNLRNVGIVQISNYAVACSQA